MGLIRSLADGWPWQPQLEREEPVPLEGTRMDLFNSIIPNWWAENITGTLPVGTADLARRVWVANRCQHLNSSQIASMRLEWHGTPGTLEPAWVSNPDPNWYPNGVGDALYSITDQLYGWGFAILYVTDFYADGFPRRFTVLPSQNVQVRMVDGAREYKAGEDLLDRRRVVQIDRNPGVGLTGTSALYAYAQACWGLLAAQNKSQAVSQDGVPQAVVKSSRKMNKEQADALKEEWATSASSRNGMPVFLPPELDFSVLSINPADLALLDTQEWNSRVIATAYGVPSVILNMALQGGLTYQNPIALMQMWWLTELRTVSARIMNAFNAQLLPAGQWVTQDATDITLEGSIEASDDPQNVPNTSKASPVQQPLGLASVNGG